MLLLIILAIWGYMFKTDEADTVFTTECCVDHGRFDAILKKYVDEDGGVNYAGLKSSQGAFTLSGGAVSGRAGQTRRKRSNRILDQRI